jgi:fermentation-respiration switch protein FrsA (DUF1100 family)
MELSGSPTVERHLVRYRAVDDLILFAAAPEPKSFWIVPGAGHNNIVDAAGASYRERLRTFYESLH